MPDSTPATQPCARCGHALPQGFLGNTCPACLLLAEPSDSISATGETHTIRIDSDVFIPPVRAGGNAPPQHDLEVIGPYRLLEPLGEGGFGVVYRALQQEPIRREVALKLIKPGMGSREVLARFEAERRALALMEHPNIAAVLDAGTAENGQPYFVMELVRGLPITTYCDERRLTLRQRLELFIPVCQAVQHAHQKAVLHRDLKPSNILVAEVDGQPLVKVIDFGVAKALGQDGEKSWQDTLARTLEGMVVGTPQYMSPEQAGAATDIDTRSDVYTLGVILYELLCGEPPLTRESLRQAAVDEMLRRIREEEVARPSSRLTPVSEAVRARAETRQVAPERMSRELKGDLDWIVLRALEKDRERRYGSAAALAADLQRHLDDEPVEAGPPSAWYQFGKFARRNRLALASASSIALLLVAGIAVSTWQAARATRAEKQSEASARHAREANNKNLAMLREASAADYQTAAQRLEDGNYSEGVAYLARALRWQPDNSIASRRLYDGLVKLINSEVRSNLQTVLKHEHITRSAAFSTDGKRFVTVSEEGAAQIWDARTGKALGEPLRQSVAGGINRGAHFSPDASKILTVGNNTVQIWDAVTGKPLGQPMRHWDAVWNTDFSSDGAKVVTASEDKTALLWDAASGRPLGLMQHSAPVQRAYFSPDGSRIVTASWDKTAGVWDAASGSPLVILRHQAPVNNAKFSPDGMRIVTASSDDAVRVWDAITGKALGEPIHHHRVMNAKFSPDGSRIATMSDNDVRLWDAATGTAIGDLLHHDNEVWSTDFSPDGLRIVTASSDGTARVWDACSGKPLGEPLCHEQPVWSAHFRPDGMQIVTSCSDNISVWNLVRLKSLGEPLRHKEKASNPAYFSSDGSRIVRRIGAGVTGVNVRVWDSATGKDLGVQPRGFDIVLKNHQYSPDGDRFVVYNGMRGSTASLYDGKAQKIIGTLAHQSYLNYVEFSRNRSLIVTASSDETARVWDGLTGKPLGAPLPHGAAVSRAHFSPDGSQIITISDDKTARVWDVASGKPVGEPMRHKDFVSGAYFNPQGSQVITQSEGALRFWNSSTGKILREPLFLSKGSNSVVFSPDGSRIVTIGNDKTARMWDITTGSSLGEPLRYEKGVITADFSPDGNSIVTGSNDNVIMVWHSPTFAQSWEKVPDWLTAYAYAVAGVEFGSDGKIRVIPGEQRLNTLRQFRSANDLWSSLTRWAAAPAFGRTLTPDSRFTCRQIAERERDSEPLSLENIESALRYDPSVPLAHVLLAEVIEAEETRKPQEKRDASKAMQAMHLRAYGLKLLPVNDAELWCRAAESLLRQKDYPKSRQAAERALAISPGMVRAARLLEKIPMLTQISPGMDLAPHALGKNPKLTQKWRSTFFGWTAATDPIKAQDEWKSLATGLGSVSITLDQLDIDFIDKGPVDILPELGRQAGIGTENFGMIATSTMNLSKGRWKITVDADDGVRVLMNGKVVIEEWSYPRREQSTATWEQSVDGEVAVRVEYFENDGWAKLRFNIEKE